jgi:hypothetical protein
MTPCNAFTVVNAAAHKRAERLVGDVEDVGNAADGIILIR